MSTATGDRTPWCWRFTLSEQSPDELRIDQECNGARPCRHATNGIISSNGCAIWLELKQHPELKQTQPELWTHFRKMKSCLHLYEPQCVPDIGHLRLIRPSRARERDSSPKP